MTPKALLKAAHAAGHRGPALIRRFAMMRNAERRLPHERISVDVVEAAIAMEERIGEKLAGVER